MKIIVNYFYNNIYLISSLHLLRLLPVFFLLVAEEYKFPFLETRYWFVDGNLGRIFLKTNYRNSIIIQLTSSYHNKENCSFTSTRQWLRGWETGGRAMLSVGRQRRGSWYVVGVKAGNFRDSQRKQWQRNILLFLYRIYVKTICHN